MSKNRTKPSDTSAPNHAKRDLLLAVVALVAFVGLSAGLLMLFTPPRTRVPDALDEAALPKGQREIALTIVHTNDSWGYLSGCG
jgi:hypothetical protein